MLLLQRQSKSVDDASQNLQQFCDPIKALCLIYKLEKDVVDGSPDIRSKVQKFSIDSVEGGLQEIAFSRVFRVKKFKQLLNKSVF